MWGRYTRLTPQNPSQSPATLNHMQMLGSDVKANILGPIMVETQVLFVSLSLCMCPVCPSTYLCVPPLCVCLSLYVTHVCASLCVCIPTVGYWDLSRSRRKVSCVSPSLCLCLSVCLALSLCLHPVSVPLRVSASPCVPTKHNT